MRAIRRNSDNLVAYIFPDSSNVELSASGLYTEGVSRADITDLDWTVLDNVPPPQVFVGFSMSWNGSEWAIVDAPRYDQVSDLISNKARQKAKLAMKAWIEAFLARFTQDYPKEEVAAWAFKAEAARAYLAGSANSVQLSILQNEAAIKQEPLDRLAQVIVAKAALFETVIARVSGLRSVTSNAIDNALPSQIDNVLEQSISRAKAMAAQLGL